MVGGSWRALARIDMLATDFPLPITHQYRMKPSRVARASAEAGSQLDPRLVEGRRPGAPCQRAGRGDAARRCSSRSSSPRELVVSTFGIREGLLYSKLEAERRAASTR